MKYALNLAEDNRILSATFEQYAPEDAILVDELPDGDISDYLYQDGVYVYDPLPDPEVPDPVEPETNDVSWDAMAEAIKEGVNEV